MADLFKPGAYTKGNIMKKILFLFFLLPFFFNDAQANNIKPDYSWYADTIPLFKPGPYSAGDLVKDTYGTIWRARKDIKNAVSPPSYNSYWEPVKIAEPTPISVSSFAINIQDKGVKPSNTPEQNSTAIETFLNSIPEGNTPSVYAPFGEYHFARTISIYRRPIHLFGDNGTIWGNSTKFYFPPATTGIVISRGGVSIQETIIERICVIGDKSLPGENDGFTILARAKIRDCTAKGFVHYGFSVWANMEEGNDASGSVFESCHALENKLDGFFAGRVDGNAILFINCDSRDNSRFGFNDDSFLGNTFISCMAHNNAQGHYNVRDKGNARTNIIAAYCEGGSPASQLSTHTTVVGGIWASGYDSQDGKGVQYK